MTESRRRVRYCTGILEDHLARHEWIAGDTFSLGDINGFNLGYALPLSIPEQCNDAKTPRIMEWLRRIYERPTTKQIWGLGRTTIAQRVKFLERSTHA